jgi:hypothetical protein
MLAVREEARRDTTTEVRRREGWANIWKIVKRVVQSREMAECRKIRPQGKPGKEGDEQHTLWVYRELLSDDRGRRREQDWRMGGEATALSGDMFSSDLAGKEPWDYFCGEDLLPNCQRACPFPNQ